MLILWDSMCLIILAHRVRRDLPVIVAANRDEQRSRPAATVQLLREGPPRLAGGLDLSAGGTWMAVGEHGVIAGLTNQRGLEGRKANRRSRGELPLLLAGAPSASDAAQRARGLDPGRYNSCTLLVADRERAFYVELVEETKVEPLSPGIHILENRLLGAPSPKADRVRERLGAVVHRDDAELRAHLAEVLADRTIPASVSGDRPPQLEAARVELGPYGTRSATLVLTRADGAPELWHSDTAPGDGPFTRRQPFD